MRSSILLLCALLPGGAFAQDSFASIDATRIELTHSSGMGFETGPGELHATTLDVAAYLGQPWDLGGNWKLATQVRYRATLLDGEGLAPGFPFKDETLQTLAIRGTLLNSSDSSPWIYGLWGQAAVSSDFQDIGGDAFLFDVGAGWGYKFSDKFTLLGLVLANELNGDASVYPGIGFDWKVNECVRVGLYGPNFVASYQPDSNWIFSLKAEPGGGVWNIDGRLGRSERLEFRSHEIGLHVERRLHGSWWLDLGAGVTLNNKIELGSTSGLTNFKDHLEDGWFVSAGIRLAAW